MSPFALTRDPGRFSNPTPFPEGIVDSQIHLFRTIGVEEGLAAMNALGIQGAVIDEYWVVREGERDVFPGYALPNGVARVTPSQAAHAASRYPDRLAYLVRTDHRDPDVEGRIRSIAETPGARAARFIVRSDAEVRDFVAGGYAPCFRAAADHGVPVFVFLDEGDTAPLVQYLRAFPSVPVIVDHIGMGRSEESVRTPDKFEAMLSLATFANVYVKWCHAYFGFGPARYPFEGTHGPLRRAVDAFGAQRLMWASDFTIRESEVCWMDRLLSVRESPVLSPDEKAWILGKTARNVLDWPAPKASAGF